MVKFPDIPSHELIFNIANHTCLDGAKFITLLIQQLKTLSRLSLNLFNNRIGDFGDQANVIHQIFFNCFSIMALGNNKFGPGMLTIVRNKLKPGSMNKTANTYND